MRLNMAEQVVTGIFHPDSAYLAIPNKQQALTTPLTGVVLVGKSPPQSERFACSNPALIFLALEIAVC